MSDELTLEGVLYISSKRAAEITGYSRDYVGQLARGGKISARRVGGLWYVVADSILKHKNHSDTYVPVPPASTTSTKSSGDSSIVGMDGRTYVSASRAAKLTSYHQDYIGQLARGGKVLSQQVGNRWYVDIDALKEHKAEKDALLAAVQINSVGLSKSVTESKAETSQGIDEVPDVGLHYKYKPEIKPFLPEIQHKEEPKDTVVYEDALNQVNTIPIRVVNTFNIEKDSKSVLNTTKSTSRMPGKSIYLRLISTLMIITIGLLIYNVDMDFIVFKTSSFNTSRYIPARTEILNLPSLASLVSKINLSLGKTLEYHREGTF